MNHDAPCEACDARVFHIADVDHGSTYDRVVECRACGRVETRTILARADVREVPA